MGPLYFLTLVLLQYYQTCSVFLTSIGNAKFNFAAYQHLQLSIVFSEQRKETYSYPVLLESED